MTEQKSPLTAADPKSIDDLFSEDPLNLTDEDLDKMVAYYRENRDKWAKEESAAAAEGRRRRPKEYKPAPNKGKLSLGDLGLTKKES